MRANYITVLAIILVIHASLIALLNQRQEVAVWLFLPVIAVGFPLLVPSFIGRLGGGFSALAIGSYIVAIALISHVSLFDPSVKLSLKYWLWFLYPFVLLALCFTVFQESAELINIFLVIFLLVFLVAVAKAFDASLSMQVDQGVKRQSNWGNLVGAASPYIFLVKRETVKQVLILFSVTGLLISLKRSGMLVASVILSVYFLSLISSFRFSSKQRLGKLAPLLLGVVLFGYALFFALNNKSLIDYIEIAMLRMSRATEDGGSGRTDIWGYGLDVVQNGNVFQIIFGRGFGWLHNEFVGNAYVVESFHNDLVEVLVAFGVLGGVMYVFFFLRIMYLGFFSHAASENRYFGISLSMVFLIYSMLSGIFFYIFFFVPVVVGVAFLEARNLNIRSSARYKC